MLSRSADSFNNPDVCCLEMLVVRTLATFRTIYVAGVKINKYIGNIVYKI